MIKKLFLLCFVSKLRVRAINSQHNNFKWGNIFAHICTLVVSYGPYPWFLCQRKWQDSNPPPRERLSTVNLLVIISLDQLIFILKIVFTFVTKQATLMRIFDIPVIAQRQTLGLQLDLVVRQSYYHSKAKGSSLAASTGT